MKPSLIIVTRLTSLVQQVFSYQGTRKAVFNVSVGYLRVIFQLHKEVLTSIPRQLHSLCSVVSHLAIHDALPQEGDIAPSLEYTCVGFLQHDDIFTTFTTRHTALDECASECTSERHVGVYDCHVDM